MIRFISGCGHRSVKVFNHGHDAGGQCHVVIAIKGLSVLMGDISLRRGNDGFVPC